MRSIFCSVVLIIIVQLPCGATPHNFAAIDSPSGRHQIGTSAQYFLDPGKKLAIGDVASPGFAQKFIPFKGRVMNFGYTKSAVWASFRLKNSGGDAARFYLNIPYSLLDDIRFYIPEGTGSFIEKKGGRNYPFSRKEIQNNTFAFSFDLKKNEEKTFFLRVETKDSLPLPLEVKTPEEIYQSGSLQQLLLGMYYGLIAVMIVFNLFIFLGTRDVNYIFYVLTLVSMHLFFQMGINGLSFEYLGNASIWWSRTSIAFFVSMGILWGILFGMKFLNTQKTIPLIHWALRAGLAWSAVEIILSLAVDYYYAVQSAVIMAMFAGGMLFVAGLASLAKGNRAARFYMLSWVPIIFGGITYGLKVFALVPSNLFTEYGYQAGGAVQAALLSIALADNINLLRREKYLIQKDLLARERREREEQERFSQELEKLVAERTENLNTALEELKKRDTLIQNELSLAADIQEGLMPQPRISFNGITVVSYYNSMEKIGGDFLDIFPMSSGHLCVIISDVSGHGIPAAFVTAMAKITFHEAVASQKFPVDIFRHVNQQLLKSVKTQEYLTAFMLIISPSYEVFYANASHTNAIVRRRTTGEIEEWDTGGLFIGATLEANALFEQKQDYLDFGDRVVLYTDGLTEARDVSGEEFGLQRLLDLVSKTGGKDIEEIRKSIIDSWESFTDGAQKKDDVSFIILEIDMRYKTLLEHKNRGLEQIYHNNNREAILEFEKALEIDPDNIYIHNLLGKCHYREKNYTEAILHMDRYLGLNDTDADSLLIAAASYYNNKEFKRAMEYSSRACSIRTNFISAMEIWGLSCMKLGNNAEARKIWENMLKVDPLNITASSRLQKLGEKE